MTRFVAFIILLVLTSVYAKIFQLPQEFKPRLNDPDKREWWENANYYQIYPRSFYDSDNNGIGDLKGIEMKAEYLKELGMDGVWLSPIMKSPMVVRYWTKRSD